MANKFNEKKVGELLSNLSTEETKKLADILAVMQKISDEEKEKILPREEIKNRAEVAKNQLSENLPQKPKSFLLRKIREKQESKIAKCKDNIKGINEKISNKDRQAKKIQNKINRARRRIEKFRTANAYLRDNVADNSIKDFLLDKNEDRIYALENSIYRHEIQLAKIEDKKDVLRNQIKDENREIENRNAKINRINAVENLPKGAILFFLAEKMGIDDKVIDNFENDNFTKATEFVENFVSEKLNTEPIPILENAEQLQLYNEFTQGEKVSEIIEYQSEIDEIAQNLDVNSEVFENAFNTAFEKGESEIFNTKFGEVNLKFHRGNGGYMLDVISDNKVLTGSYCFKSQEEQKKLNLISGLNFNIKSDIKDGKLKPVYETETSQEDKLKASIISVQNSTMPKIQLENTENSNIFVVNLGKSKEENFNQLVIGLEKVGFDNDIAFATAVKLSTDTEYDGFLKIPVNEAEDVAETKEEKTEKQAEIAETKAENSEIQPKAPEIINPIDEFGVLPPPDFEYFPQPINAQQLTAENLSKSDNLGKIELSKDQLADLKPQLKYLKENGLIQVKTSDKPDKFNVFFKKENREAVETAINSIQKKQTAQTAKNA